MEAAGESRAHGLSRARLDRGEALNSVVTRIAPASTPPPGPLAGMAVGVKDNIAVAGVPTTCASAFFLDNIANADATVVRRLRAAGADITATLNMAEFAVGVTSQNSVHGGPRNPWDTAKVPSGSSGGSGAAVAAGLVDVALGTDTGGSIRLPSAACGVTGLRPTIGKVPVDGIVPVSLEFDTVGPMARSVSAVAKVFDVLAHVSSPRGPSVRRIGIAHEFVTSDIDPAITRAIEAFVTVLERLRYEVVPVVVPGAESAQEAAYQIMYHDLAVFHRRRLTDPDRWQPATLERVRLGTTISGADRAVAVRRRDDYRRGLADLFNDVDVVVTPTLPVDVPPRDETAAVVAQSRRLAQLTYPWSLHDGPTLALPIGFHASSGMPVGAQLTAAAHGEHRLFEVGAAYQTVTDWHERRPPVSL